MLYNDFEKEDFEAKRIFAGYLKANDLVLRELWYEFRNIKYVDKPVDISVKQKVLRPLVGTFRLN